MDCRSQPSVWTRRAALFQDTLSPTGTSCFLVKLQDCLISTVPTFRSQQAPNTWLFTWVLGVKFRIFQLLQQVLYPISHTSLTKKDKSSSCVRWPVQCFEQECPIGLGLNAQEVALSEKGLRGLALLEKCHQGWALRFQKPKPGPVTLSSIIQMNNSLSALRSAWEPPCSPP